MIRSIYQDVIHQLHNIEFIFILYGEIDKISMTIKCCFNYANNNLY